MIQRINHRLGQHEYLYMGRRLFHHRDRVNYFYIRGTALD